MTVESPLLIVTEADFPAGLPCCGNCGRPIEPGEEYKNRSLLTGKVSTGPYDDETTDGVFCADC